MIEANQKGEYSVFAFKGVFSDGEQSFDNREWTYSQGLKYR